MPDTHPNTGNPFEASPDLEAEADFLARAERNLAGWAKLYEDEGPWFEIDGGAPPEIEDELKSRSNALMEERMALLRIEVQTLRGLRTKAHLAALFIDESDDNEASDFFGVRRLLADVNRLIPA